MAYISTVAAVFPILIGIYFLFQKPRSSPSHDALPIVSVGRLRAHADEFFKEGYRKYPSDFHVPEPFSHYLVVLPKGLTSELKGVPETELSQKKALEVDFVISKTLYTALTSTNLMHAQVLRGTLTPKLGDLLGELEEEAGLAFEEEWGCELRDGEWAEINAFEMGLKISSRSNHRVVMGLPLCMSYIQIYYSLALSEGAFASASRYPLIDSYWHSLGRDGKFNKLC
jgi:hypothetical protein